MRLRGATPLTLAGRPAARSRFGAWAAGELRPLRRLLSWPVALVLAATALGLLAAYQRVAPQRVDVGGTPLLDYPYLADVYEPETSTTERVPFDYRWTYPESTVSLPGLGAADYGLALTVSPGPNPAPALLVRSGETSLAPLPLSPGARSYNLLLPRAAVSDGNILLVLSIAPYASPGDGRKLGVALGGAAAQALPRGPIVPPVADLLLLLAATGLAMAVAARAGMDLPVLAAVGGLVGIACVATVALDRLWLSPVSSTLPAALLGALLLLIGLDPPLRRLWRALGWDSTGEPPPGDARWLRLLLATAFVVYLAGMLHPQMQMFDIAFHVNRFNDVWRGGRWFITVGSAEWGGGQTYYPPLTYLLLGPLALLTGSPATAIVLLMALLLVVRLLLVYLLTRHGTGSARAGLFAALLLALLPANMLPHQWGIVSNLLGETLTLLAVTLVLLGSGRLRRPALFVALVVTLAMMLISHPGALVLGATLMLALIGLLWLRPATRPEARAVALAFTLACGLSFGLYHWRAASAMLPQARAILARQLGGTGRDATVQPPGASCRLDRTDAPLKVQVGGSVSDGRLGLHQRCVHSWSEVISGGALGLVAEARAYYLLVPLLAVPWALASLWRGTAGPAGAGLQRRLGGVLAAWLLVAAVFALVGVAANLYVRYPLFAAPAVAACAAIALDRIASHGWGRYVAFGALLALTVAGLSEWYARIMVTNH